MSLDNARPLLHLCVQKVRRITMEAGQFTCVAIAMVLIFGLPDVHGQVGNCTKADVDEKDNECKTLHPAESTVTSFEPTKINDPSYIWGHDQICKNVKHFGTYASCVMNVRIQCVKNTSLEGSYPTAGNVKAAIEYLCSEKDAYLNVLNETDKQDVLDCLEEQSPDYRTCVEKRAIDGPSDICSISADMVICVKDMGSECVEDEPDIFITFVELLHPEHCAACTISAVLATVVMAVALVFYTTE